MGIVVLLGGGGGPPPLPHRRNLIRLELAVGHRERGDPKRLFREMDSEPAEDHAAAQRLRLLRELFGSCERSETGAEVLHCLFAEVGIALPRANPPLHLPSLQPPPTLPRPPKPLP